ncbi:MAG: RNB domain-containing ribonuclease [Oscillospiraceae bacterium]
MNNLTVLEVSLLEYIRGNKKKLNIDDLKTCFKVDHDKMASFYGALKCLQLQGEIFLDHKGYYRLLDKGKMAVGQVFFKGKYFYVKVNGQDFYVKKANSNGALCGDTVLLDDFVLREYESGSRLLASVRSVLKRDTGLVVMESKDGKLKPVDSRIAIEVDFPDELPRCIYYGVKVGTDLGLEGYEVLDIKEIGSKFDKSTFEKAIIFEGGFVAHFPEAVENEALSYQFDQEARRRNRVGHRTLLLEEDGKLNHQNAFSIFQNDNGNIVLELHVPDIAYYANPIILDEAIKRGVKFDLDGKIPIYPDIIENSLCYFSTNHDCLSKTCQVEFTPAGEIVGQKFYDGVIKIDDEVSEKDTTEEVLLLKEVARNFETQKSLNQTVREAVDKVIASTYSWYDVPLVYREKLKVFTYPTSGDQITDFSSPLDRSTGVLVQLLLERYSNGNFEVSDLEEKINYALTIMKEREERFTRTKRRLGALRAEREISLSPKEKKKASKKEGPLKEHRPSDAVWGEEKFGDAFVSTSNKFSVDDCLADISVPGDDVINFGEPDLSNRQSLIDCWLADVEVPSGEVDLGTVKKL